MADVCSFSKKGFLECGSSRGRSKTVFLYECRDYLSAHLKNCFLSRADLKEYEVILQRAGLEYLSHEQVKKLRVCPRHRYGLGKYWRPSKLCQYPGHKGKPTSVKSRDVINPAIGKEVFQLFGISVPIGSRKYTTHDIWKISLSQVLFILQCISYGGFFIFSLAICSPCRKKHKADTNSTSLVPEEECRKTHTAEKTYTLRYA